MHPSERNRLTKLQLALLVAVSDMNQASAAAQSAQDEIDGGVRALETAGATPRTAD
jgi:2-keto-3-deoxy-6-phosphogluconate aldolase